MFKTFGDAYYFYAHSFQTNSVNYSPETDHFIKSVIYELKEFWIAITKRLSTDLSSIYWEMSCEKYELLKLELCNIYKKDSDKTLVFVESTLVGRYMTECLNSIPFEDASTNLRPIQSLLYTHKYTIGAQINAQRQTYLKEFEKGVKEMNQKFVIPDPNYPQYNMELYYDALKDIISETFLIQENDDKIAKSPIDFDTKGCSIMVSTVLDSKLLINPNTKIILFNEKAFKNVIYAPAVLSNKIKVVSVRDSREEITRKINKIERLMK